MTALTALPETRAVLTVLIDAGRPLTTAELTATLSTLDSDARDWAPPLLARLADPRRFRPDRRAGETTGRPLLRFVYLHEHAPVLWALNHDRRRVET